MLESNQSMSLDEQMEDLYGPLPEFSDYKRGERLTYYYGGQMLTGTILWVSGPEIIADKQYPSCYIVQSDQEQGIPHHVALGEVVEQ